MTGGHMADGDEPGWREREQESLMRTSKERLTEIRSSAEVGKANGITAERRYGGDAYADRVWLVTEVDRLQDRCAEFEANLTIAERQVTEARMELDRRSDETFVRRCGFVGMYDIPCGLNAGHEGAHRVYGPHTKLSKTTAGDELNGESNPRAGASVSQPSPAVGPSEKAFVQLCAPHGNDWLTCPECAKAAVNGAEPCTK